MTARFQPRTRELLVFLAVHPDGVTREALVAAMWPQSPPARITTTLNSALTRLRRSVTDATGGAVEDITLIGEDRYRLDPAVVEVDFTRFDDALGLRRAAVTAADRAGAYRAMIGAYGGPLADGMSTEWIESARLALNRQVIDAVAALARTLIELDPEQTLDLLEVARAFDPHNELLYRDIMRLQAHLGQLDAISRTLALLSTRLAEIGENPTPHTVELAAALTRRHDSPRPTPQSTHIVPNSPTRQRRNAAS